MDTKKQILKDLNDIEEKYKQYMLKVIEKDPKIHTKTLMINTVLQRSLSIIDVYMKIFYSNNILVLNSLTRMQLDNCIFIYGIYLLNSDGYDVSKVYKEIFQANKKLSEYTVNKREKLYDTYIVGKINKEITNFKGLYDFCCRFIHYSDTASFLTMNTKEDFSIEFNLSTDYKRFRCQNIINGRSFVEVSKLILIMITKYWRNIDKGNTLLNDN